MVTSSTPANGATDIASGDMISVSFTFNQPLDLSQKFGELALPVDFLNITPEDSISILNYKISPDHKTVTIQVSQKANTDFVWILLSARSESGQLLSSPYILDYTTCAKYGKGMVTGTVTLKGKSASRVFVALSTKKPDWGPNEMRSLYAGSDYAVSGLQKLNPNTKNPTITSTVSCAAAVSDSDGSYTMDVVRDSVYYPIAMADLNSDGQINPLAGDAIGFYDPNNDGVPDSIVVHGDIHANINIKMFDFDPVTAETYLPKATDVAAKYANDQLLYYILSLNQKVTPEGKSPFWAYIFHSNTKKLNTVVIGSPFGFSADTSLSFLDNYLGTTSSSLEQVGMDLYVTQESASSFISSFKYPIPSGGVTSTRALTLAEANGGSDFRNTHSLYNVLVAGGQASKMTTTDTTQTVWTVTYQSFDGNSSSPSSKDKKLSFVISMSNGDILQEEHVSTTPVQQGPQQQKPDQVELMQNYPNPFNPTTHIDFVLPRASKLTLRVYNLLGQEVSELVNGRLSAGRHSVTFNANNFSSGIYFYRLQTGNKVLTKKLTLLK